MLVRLAVIHLIINTISLILGETAGPYIHTCQVAPHVQYGMHTYDGLLI